LIIAKIPLSENDLTLRFSSRFSSAGLLPDELFSTARSTAILLPPSAEVILSRAMEIPTGVKTLAAIILNGLRMARRLL
jgi:hypothetical protein